MAHVVLAVRKLGYKPTGQDIKKLNGSGYSQLVLHAEGDLLQEGITEALESIKGVHTVINIERENYHGSTIEDATAQSNIPKKQQCKTIMIEYFGDSIVDSIDQMTEENCVSLCRAKVVGLIGEKGAQAFDKIH